MEITNEVKQRIVAAIAADRENYPSDNRHATALGIAPSVYNTIKRGNYEKQVSDANWVGIALSLIHIFREKSLRLISCGGIMYFQCFRSGLRYKQV